MRGENLTAHKVQRAAAKRKRARAARAKRAEPSTASLKRTVARCLDLLERINNREPWTAGDVDVVLDECRSQICRACRNGRPHSHGDEIYDD